MYEAAVKRNHTFLFIVGYINSDNKEKKMWKTLSEKMLLILEKWVIFL